MSSLQQFRFEICGHVTSSPNHWFVIRCSNTELPVLKWKTTAASTPGTRHFCGEAHAGVYISRGFDSVCSPSKPYITK